MTAAQQNKFDHMRSILGEMRSVVVAFSAGVDSSVVLKMATDVLGKTNVLAATADSPSVPRAEIAHARKLASLIGARHVMVATDEFESADYLANPIDRCYHCKHSLYTHLAALRDRYKLAWVANGTNVDDQGDWRPGLKAAGEFCVRAPAAEAGLNKQDIREMARQLGLPNHDKPASPCLSSRIPYGQPVTEAKLRSVERAEAFLRDHLGIAQCRVRHYGSEARIEVQPNWIPRLTTATMQTLLADEFGKCGFDEVTVDPKGFRSGSLNEVIAFGRRQQTNHATRL